MQITTQRSDVQRCADLKIHVQHLREIAHENANIALRAIGALAAIHEIYLHVPASASHRDLWDRVRSQSAEGGA